MAERSIIVSSLDPIKAGEQFKKWPRHITVVPWFFIPETSKPSFKQALKKRAKNTSRLTVIGDREALFGPKHDVRVRTLREIGLLANLHSLLLEDIKFFDGKVASEYIAQNYVPHVTYQDGRGIAAGEVLQLNAVQLIEDDTGGMRTVEQSYALSAEEASNEATS